MKTFVSTVTKSSLIFAAVGWLLCCGCSRSFWRSQADFDAYNILSQKQFSPSWVLPRTSVEPDQRSRFYDPNDRDKPPLPPDDPSANQYMQWVNGWRGYKSWHKFGQLMSVENPQWLENFGVAPDTFHDSYYMSDGVTVGTDPAALPTDAAMRVVPTIENLTLAQTIELASIHSRDYQTQLENLYLSALQLSLDQFQFSVRYLVGRAPTVPSTALPSTGIPTGILNDSVIPGTSNTLGLSTSGGLSQVLPTGGQWIVGLANNTLWLFSSGGQTTSSQSLLSYSLVQPFLAGAGRKFFLENLTFSERTVLYNVRILARYRRLFFADAVVNTGGGSNSSPAPITATSGVNVSNPAVISTNAGINVAAGTTVGTTVASVSGAPAGYYGLLYQLQQVLNQRENVEYLRIQADRLKELVAQTPFRRLDRGALPNGIEFPVHLAHKIEYTLENRRLKWKDSSLMTDQEQKELLDLSDDMAYRAAIREIFAQLRIGVTTLDYLQVATQLTNSEIREKQLKFAFDDEIDQFKFFLGVPTDMQITIDRTMLKPFELTDPRLSAIEKRLLNFVSRPARLNQLDPAIGELRFVVSQFAKLVNLVGTDCVDLVDTDIRRVKNFMPKRLSKLLWDESKEIILQRFERDALLHVYVRESYDEILKLAATWNQRLRDDDLPRKEREAVLSAVKDAREDLLQIIQNSRVLQSGLRSELIELPEFNLTLDEATDIALENRVDLMNSRARVMDARRNMEVAANRLEAVLNLVSQGNLSTSPGNHPLDFSGANSNFQLGVQMAAPLDQMQVRNAYRQSIVNYQQARRAYMLLEDQVKYDIRTSWRQLRMNTALFETTRKVLRQASLQLDINVANNLNPKQQGGGGGAQQGGQGGGGQGGGGQNVGQAGSTNLGQTGINLIQAVGAVLSAQNNLIQFWTLYERNRININRDMDIMEIDERGLWIDPVYQNLEGQSSPSHLNEPADEFPPEPTTERNESAANGRPRRSSHPGVARVGSFSSAVKAKESLDAPDRRGESGRSGRARVAPFEIRLVSDSDVFDSDSGSDGGSGDGYGEEGVVPDHRRREGGSRQHEERSPDE